VWGLTHQNKHKTQQSTTMQLTASLGGGLGGRAIFALVIRLENGTAGWDFGAEIGRGGIENLFIKMNRNRQQWLGLLLTGDVSIGRH